MKILIATEKSFSTEAVQSIKSTIEDANQEFALLENYTEKQSLLKAVENIDAIIIRSDIIDAEVMNAAKNLKLIVRAGAGYDNVDLKTATEKNICVMNTPGQNANAVAELVFGLCIFSLRNAFDGSSGRELLGKKIGLHAFGNVARNVARIAKGFGMEVYAFDPFCTKEQIESEGVIHTTSVEDLYSKCQFVSLHIPATDATRNSINYALLNRMPKNAVLINTARKEVINEKELEQVMQERGDFSYLSDVKPSNDSDLKAKFPKQYFATPKKAGAQTEEANMNAGIAAAKQTINFLINKDQTFRVNK
ncbi:Phosphoglycerate dehydrogenase [Bacteroidales bacterium]|nr:Phosphoglycerate dehydrogenase [Bacteroidales bacterium]